MSDYDYTLTKPENLDIVDLFFWAICSRKSTINHINQMRFNFSIPETNDVEIPEGFPGGIL